LLGRDKPAQTGDAATTAPGEAPVEPTAETIPLAAARTAHVESLQSQLRDLLGLPVEIALTSAEGGVVKIPFTSNDQFEHLLRVLRRSAAA
jgi:ParB family chromosome partitioning protein